MRKESAVVIGGSLAGLLAARVLADRVDQDTIMEREVLVDEALPRQYVPQGYHGHALLTAGAQTISRLFPRILEELATDGAVTANIANGIWHHGGAPRVRYESQIAHEVSEVHADLGYSTVIMDRYPGASPGCGRWWCWRTATPRWSLTCSACRTGCGRRLRRRCDPWPVTGTRRRMWRCCSGRCTAR